QATKLGHAFRRISQYIDLVGQQEAVLPSDLDQSEHVGRRCIRRSNGEMDTVCFLNPRRYEKAITVLLENRERFQRYGGTRWLTPILEDHNGAYRRQDSCRATKDVRFMPFDVDLDHRRLRQVHVVESFGFDGHQASGAVQAR